MLYHTISSVDCVGSAIMKSYHYEHTGNEAYLFLNTVCKACLNNIVTLKSRVVL